MIESHKRRTTTTELEDFVVNYCLSAVDFLKLLRIYDKTTVFPRQNWLI
jgi:hypothetical protein